MPHFDLFTRSIYDTLLLTEGMKERSEPQNLKLEIRLLEDVFLLKSITKKEGDIEDMVIIVRHGGGLNWT